MLFGASANISLEKIVRSLEIQTYAPKIVGKHLEQLPGTSGRRVKVNWMPMEFQWEVLEKHKFMVKINYIIHSHAYGIPCWRKYYYKSQILTLKISYMTA